MPQQHSFYVRFLYFILWRLVDLESLMWGITDVLVKPVAILRKRMIRFIHARLNLA